MFDFYENMTIEEAVKFQEENYFIRNDEGEVVLNISKIEECRKELLDALTGGSKEQFDNILALGKPDNRYCEDGFIYNIGRDRDSLLCVGAIAEAENMSKVKNAYDLICIADEIEEGAFAIDDNKPVTVMATINLPFVKTGCLPHHSLHRQCYGAYGVISDNLTEKECLDAISFVPTAEKLLLNVKEAHELFNLSERSLYDFARKNPNSHTLLHHGNRVYFKRELFEKYIKEQAEWNYGL